MTERYTFAVERHLVDGSVVWNQDNIDNVNSSLNDTMNEGYVTAEEDSPTRYLSVLDTTGEMTLENLNISLVNPKLEVEESEDYGSEEVLQQTEDVSDQVVVFNVEGSDELYGIQVVQDEEGNLQKYQFQFRKNDDGQLEAIPETITLIPMDGEIRTDEADFEGEVDYPPEEEAHNSMHIFVHEENSQEHILPDEHEQIQEEVMYENEEIEEETVDIKPGILQLQNVKQEIQEQVEYNTTEQIEETYQEEYQDTEQVEDNMIEYHTHIEENSVQTEENSVSSEPPFVQYQEKETETTSNQEYEQVEVNPDMNLVQNVQVQEVEENINDSDENEYQIVEGVHITGDVESNEGTETIEKHTLHHTNILKHALKANKEQQKIIKKDNKLYLYVVQHPEKENVDSLSLEMQNLCRPKVNPRSILKSSHAMFQAKNEIETSEQDDRLNKRFARCKEAVQARIFHNFINKTTIPQAPVRKNRLPRKQKIKPVERMDEEIVVQEVMVSSNGFVETVRGRGVNKENLAVIEYVDLTDSDDDYDPKRITRKTKKHRRKRIEITISDDSDDASEDIIIELDESDDEPTTIVDEKKTNNNTPSKRRRGRPPKNRPDEDSPTKRSRVEASDGPKKPEIPCPQCEKTFPSQNSLKTHLQHHSLQSSIKKALPDYKYKCESCGSTFINGILLRKHMCSKLFSCAVCKKKFTDLSTLNGHKRIHAKEQMFKSTSSVQVSPKKIKPAVQTNGGLKCKKCGKLCSSLQNLNVHSKSHREYACATCSMQFASQLVLEKHLRESCVKSQHGRRSAVARNGASAGATPASTALAHKRGLQSKKVEGAHGGVPPSARLKEVFMALKAEVGLRK